MLALPFLSTAHKVLIESRDLETEYVFGRCIPPSRLIMSVEFHSKAVEYQKWKKGQNHRVHKKGWSKFPSMCWEQFLSNFKVSPSSVIGPKGNCHGVFISSFQNSANHDINMIFQSAPLFF